VYVVFTTTKECSNLHFMCVERDTQKVAISTTKGLSSRSCYVTLISFSSLKLYFSHVLLMNILIQLKYN
jgi:hypothetical protein